MSRTIRVLLVILWIGWTGLVLYGSLGSAGDLPAMGWFGRIPHFDKLVHFGFYCGEVTLLLLLVNPRRQGKIVLVATVILLSGVIELIQPYFGRSRDLADFAANAAGALTGTLLARYLGPWLTRRQPLS